MNIRNHEVMRPHHYYVYILASKKYGTLYTGVTNNLSRRVEEHKLGKVNDFTARYKVHTLVYFEDHKDIRDALLREKQIKNWRRSWKINIINKFNPDWSDLVNDIAQNL